MGGQRWAGRQPEVIQQWIRVSQRGILLGVGYHLPDTHPA
jgi:hypothetical protein